MFDVTATTLPAFILSFYAETIRIACIFSLSFVTRKVGGVRPKFTFNLYDAKGTHVEEEWVGGRGHVVPEQGES